MTALPVLVPGFSWKRLLLSTADALAALPGASRTGLARADACLSVRASPTVAPRGNQGDGASLRALLTGSEGGYSAAAISRRAARIFLRLDVIEHRL